MPRFVTPLVLVALFFTLFASIPAAAQGEGGADAMTLGISGKVTLNGVLSDPGSYYTRLTIDLFQESLIDLRNDELVPELATKYQQLDDEGAGNAYAFTLDPAKRWSDGVPVTAADVEFTFRSVLDSELASPYRAQLQAVLAARETVTTGDFPFHTEGTDTFVVVANDVSETAFLEAMMIPIVPEHIWGTIPLSGWRDDAGSTGADPTRVVGTGQYMFESRRAYVDLACPNGANADRPPESPDEEIILRLNPEYRSALPLWDTYATFTLNVFVCPQGEQSTLDRIDWAIRVNTVHSQSLEVAQTFDILDNPEGFTIGNRGGDVFVRPEVRPDEPSIRDERWFRDEPGLRDEFPDVFRPEFPLPQLEPGLFIP